jgi:protein CpxP
MNKRLVIFIVGALIAVGALGFAFGPANVSAAEPAKQPPMTMQPGQMGNMDPKAMADMMKSPEMQKQCVEYMKSPEMQQAMMGIMKQPEMQAAMKQMLQSDAGFHQVMLDLVNSVDMNMDHGTAPPTSQPSGNSAGFDHGSHHR